MGDVCDVKIWLRLTRLESLARPVPDRESCLSLLYSAGEVVLSAL
jgi:hypothetical protein